MLIDFRVNGLMCEIMFTSLARLCQAHTGLFLHLVTTAGGSYFSSTQPIGSMVLLPIHPSLPLLISKISLKTYTHLSC